jgi:hypothetical protein
MKPTAKDWLWSVHLKDSLCHHDLATLSAEDSGIAMIEHDYPPAILPQKPVINCSFISLYRYPANRFSLSTLDTSPPSPMLQLDRRGCSCENRENRKESVMRAFTKIHHVELGIARQRKYHCHPTSVDDRLFEPCGEAISCRKKANL